MALLAWFGREVQPSPRPRSRPSFEGVCFLSLPIPNLGGQARSGETNPAARCASARTHRAAAPKKTTHLHPPYSSKIPWPYRNHGWGKFGSAVARRRPVPKTRLLIPVRAMCCDGWIWKRTTQPDSTPGGFGLGFGGAWADKRELRSQALLGRDSIILFLGRGITTTSNGIRSYYTAHRKPG